MQDWEQRRAGVSAPHVQCHASDPQEQCLASSMHLPILH
jgi:hypothetical protein